jgi:hypothetical protein
MKQKQLIELIELAPIDILSYRYPIGTIEGNARSHLTSIFSL